jgi:uncharacterized alpha-E superfamily protein
LVVQTAFGRGRAEAARWDWILTLYQAGEAFKKRYPRGDRHEIIEYHLTDSEHTGSIHSTLAAAHANARALRAVISTDLWTHINRTFNAVKTLEEEAIGEKRLATTCERIQIDCYALLGIASSTLYRDAGYRFFELGIQAERADQMSRLLDVRFAQLGGGNAARDGDIGDYALWSMLLRSCGGHHAYRQLVAGPLRPELVARFLIFEQSFARSIAHCLRKVNGILYELRDQCSVPMSEPVLERSHDLSAIVQMAQSDASLVRRLHDFNDGIQRRLIAFTEELAEHYFDLAVAKTLPAGHNPPPNLHDPAWAVAEAAAEQTGDAPAPEA